MASFPDDPRASNPGEEAAFALRLKAPRVSSPDLEPADAERLRAQARWEPLIELLLTQHDVATVPAEKARLLVEVAEVFREGLGDRGQALDALIEAWRTDPTYDPAIAPLEELGRALGRWPEIFQVTEGMVATERDQARALALYERMVWWLTIEVPTPQLAAHYAARIRVVDSTHSAVHLDQATVFRAHGDLKRELPELDRAALSARRPEDRAKLHVLMAARYEDERMRNPVEARKHLVAALAQDPRSMHALRGLAAIHERDGDIPALADVLEKQVDVAQTDEERIALLVRLASLYETHFLKPDRAADKLQLAFTLDSSNAEALSGLERCYTATRAWPELARALEVATLSDDDDVRRHALGKLAEVQESRLEDATEARKTYGELHRLIPADEGVLGHLARLSEKLGDWRSAASWRGKLAELTSEPVASARMHVAAGQLLAAADREPALARVHFEEAVVRDPSNEAAWNALIWDAREAQDYARLAGYLEKRAEAAEAPRLKGELYVELARVRMEQQSDELGALQAYESARTADPTNENAARALLELYVATERWEEADALCERAAIAAERDGDSARLCWALRLGRKIALAFQDNARALSISVSCFELRPEDPEVRAELIESALAMKAEPGALGRAREALTLLAEQAPGLPAGVRGELGEALEAAGDTERARALYESALAESPQRAGALAGLARVHAGRGDAVAAAEYMQTHAHALEDDAERPRRLVEAAEAYAKADRLDLAIGAYQEARALRPTDQRILHALLAAQQKLERWAEVSDTLRAIVIGDDDAMRRSKTLYAMAQIARDKLDDPARAIALFEEALDHDPSRLEAFERVVRLLTDRRDWPALEASYRRMLGRVFGRGDVTLQHALYHQLGLVYRDRLKDPDRAIDAFRAAAELRPESQEDQAILRELMTLRGRVQDAAILALEQALRDPLAPGPYPALFDLLLRGGAFDRAWCVASVMAHLGILGEREAAFLRARPPLPLTHLRGALDEGLRARLLHAELDPSITAIFEIVAPALLEVRAAQVPWKDRLGGPGPALGGRGTPTASLGETAARAASALGLAAPRLYGRTGAGSALVIGPTRPPSLLVATQALDALPEPVHPFLFGKRIFEQSPKLLVRGLCPSVSELAGVLATVARAIGPREQPRAPADEAFRARLGRGELQLLTDAFASAQARGLTADHVQRWSELADASTTRAGLLLVGDVDLARSALAREPQSPADLSPREQVRELVTFALGDAFGELRVAIGSAIRG